MVERRTRINLIKNQYLIKVIWRIPFQAEMIYNYLDLRFHNLVVSKTQAIKNENISLLFNAIQLNSHLLNINYKN